MTIPAPIAAPLGRLDVFEIHEFHWALCENAARGWCMMTGRDFETSIDKASGRKSFVWRGVRVLAQIPAPVNKVAS